MDLGWIAILVFFGENEWLGFLLGTHLPGALMDALLDVFLGVVPGSTGVGEAEGDLNTRHDDACEEATECVFAEEHAND